MDKDKLGREITEFFQMAPLEIIIAAARGEVDLNEFARQQLANRGLNEQGAWIGFKD